jgi:hypothetical protein
LLFSIGEIVPATVKAKLLLGWMPRAEALLFLTNSCVFKTPMTEESAVGLWQTYKAKVAALPKRTCNVAKSIKLNRREQEAIADFKKSPKHSTDTIHDVVKMDPSGLVLHQFYVVTERSEEYVKLMHNDRQRIKHSFGLDKQEIETVTNGSITLLKFPHFEYDVKTGVLPDGRPTINIVEWPRYISAVRREDRILLWGGYHRIYAFLSNSFSKTEPDGPDDPPLVTLITHPGVEQFFSAASERPDVRDCVLGDCPALFSDFFNPDLFMEVSFVKRQKQVKLDSANQTAWHGLVDIES